MCISWMRFLTAETTGPSRYAVFRSICWFSKPKLPHAFDRNTPYLPCAVLYLPKNSTHGRLTLCYTGTYCSPAWIVWKLVVSRPNLLGIKEDGGHVSEQLRCIQQVWSQHSCIAKADSWAAHNEVDVDKSSNSFNHSHQNQKTVQFWRIRDAAGDAIWRPGHLFVCLCLCVKSMESLEAFCFACSAPEAKIGNLPTQTPIFCFRNRRKTPCQRTCFLCDVGATILSEKHTDQVIWRSVNVVISILWHFGPCNYTLQLGCNGRTPKPRLWASWRGAFLPVKPMRKADARVLWQTLTKTSHRFHATDLPDPQRACSNFGVVNFWALHQHLASAMRCPIRWVKTWNLICLLLTLWILWTWNLMWSCEVVRVSDLVSVVPDGGVHFVLSGWCFWLLWFLVLLKKETTSHEFVWPLSCLCCCHSWTCP